MAAEIEMTNSAPEYGRPMLDSVIYDEYMRGKVRAAMEASGQGWRLEPLGPCALSGCPKTAVGIFGPGGVHLCPAHAPKGEGHRSVVRCGGFEQKMIDGRLVSSACLEQGEIPLGQRWFFCPNHLSGYPKSEPPPPPTEEPSRKLWLEDVP